MIHETVRTVTACSFGDGSVVMMARAAAAPPVRSRSPTAFRMPDKTRSIGSLTPMTPVLATSTSSGRQPMAAAVLVAICMACDSPSSPVQALAQPLLMTTARAQPSVRWRCCRETCTGAACARFVVKIPAALAVDSAAITVRSSADAAALMPLCTDPAWNPSGAAMPPGDRCDGNRRRSNHLSHG